MTLKDPISPAWEYWGQELDWYTRRSEHKHLHGQALFPRSTVPPGFGGRDYKQNPDPTKPFPPIDQVKCCWQPPQTSAHAYLHFTAAYTSSIYDGLSVFQINPRARGKSWELKHTRHVVTSNIGDMPFAGWYDFYFVLAWPCATQDELRVLIRVWNRIAFSPFPPVTSVPY